MGLNDMIRKKGMLGIVGETNFTNFTDFMACYGLAQMRRFQNYIC